MDRLLGSSPLACIAAVALASTACSSGDEKREPAVDPLSFAVDQPGPANVGYRTLDTTYQPPGPSPERTIVLNVWYPTDDSEGPSPTYEQLFTDPDVFEGATLAAPLHAGGYPVLVHSHGFRGYGGNSADVMRYFATHGWVVVAPDHEDNTLLGNVDPLPTRHYYERPLDIRAALDALAQLPEDDPLHGSANLAAVAMSGHSFGVYTTWAVGGAAFDPQAIELGCADGDVRGECLPDELAVFTSTDLSDPRPRALIPMAGGKRDQFFGADGLDAIELPVMIMTGTADNPDSGRAVFETVDGPPITWVNVEGGCHQLFGFGGCPEVEDAEGFGIVNTYAFAFARHHVLGDDSERTMEILSGAASISPRVALRVSQ